MPESLSPFCKYIEISPPKTESFQIKISDIFYISAQNIDCEKHSDIFYISAQNIDCGYSLEPPRRCGSNEYPQSMLFEQK